MTTNGIQQKSDFRATAASATCRSGRTCSRRARRAAGTFPLFTGIRVFDRDYKNPRIYSVNAGYERELAPSMAAYVDFTYAKGVHLTRFLNYNVHGTARRASPAGDARHDDLHRRQSIRAAARRRVRDQQPRARRSIAARPSACGSASRRSTSSRRTTCCRRMKTTTRTSAIRSPIARSTSTI